jgi:RNA polymerase sigma-70 factor (ECF subfamily)
MTRIPVETRTSREQAVSDVTLLERVAEGDVRALSELSARHSLSLRALALGMLRDPVEAEQVVQATFRAVRYEAARFDLAHFPVFGWLAELTRVGALQRSRVNSRLGVYP